jgi:hypothetical protein
LKATILANWTLLGLFTLRGSLNDHFISVANSMQLLSIHRSLSKALFHPSVAAARCIISNVLLRLSVMFSSYFPVSIMPLNLLPIDESEARAYRRCLAVVQGLFSPVDQTDGSSSGHFAVLQSSLVDLPGDNPAFLLDILPPDIRHLCSLQHICKSQDILSSACNIFHGFSCAVLTKDDYLAIIVKLFQAGAIVFKQEAIVNGIFGVWKSSERQRFIIDMSRTSSVVCEEPPPLALPSPDLLIQMSSRDTLFLSKIDLTNFYFALETPPDLHILFGLPPLRHSELLSVSISLSGDESSFWIPCFNRLAMGWNWSAYFAHTANDYVLEVSGLYSRFNKISVSSAHVDSDKGFAGSYIDDLFGFHQSAVILDSEFQSSVIPNYDTYKLPVNFKKSKAPSTTANEALGISLVDNILTSSPAKLLSILSHVHSVDQERSVSIRNVESLVGHLVWHSLLRRPLLSCLFEVFNFTFFHSENPLPTPIWAGVQSELFLASSLLPLAQASLSRDWSNFVFFFDASLSGFGAAFIRLPSPPTLGFYKRTHSQASLSPLLSFLNLTVDELSLLLQTSHPLVSGNWHWLHSFPRLTFPIAHLELLAFIISFAEALRQFPNEILGKRVGFVSDSECVVFALQKGRSSTLVMNSLLRVFAGIMLPLDILPVFFWISSELNPADGLSRC